MKTPANFFPHLHSLGSACVLPGWTNCPCCIRSQTGGYIGFRLAAFMRLWIQVGQRWQCLLSARSMTLVWRSSLCTVFGLSLVFWANFWLCACCVFVFLPVCVFEEELEQPLMSSQRAERASRTVRKRGRWHLQQTLGEQHTGTHESTEIQHYVMIQLLHKHADVWAHTAKCNILQTSRNTSKCSMFAQTSTHSHSTHKGPVQLLPPHTVNSRDLYALKQSGTVRFRMVSIRLPCVGPLYLQLRSCVWSVGGHATGNRNVSDEMMRIFVSYPLWVRQHLVSIPRVKEQYFFLSSGRDYDTLR